MTSSENERRAAFWFTTLLLRALPLSATVEEALASASLAVEIQPEASADVLLSMQPANPKTTMNGDAWHQAIKIIDSAILGPGRTIPLDQKLSDFVANRLKWAEAIKVFDAAFAASNATVRAASKVLNRNQELSALFSQEARS